MTETVRVAMWSGPRNISTAMMRSFGARSDTAVIDEPFYAVYLSKTGLQHPMREEVLASQSQDWREVAAALVGAVPRGKRIYYQKHMTHHMIDAVGLDWMRHCRSAFLIRDPRAVLASYALKRNEVELRDIGIVRQHELFEREAEKLGRAPPVVDGADVLAKPRETLALLCAALGIDYTNEMLNWNAGRRETDGVWAPVWYGAVERSTGFELPPDKAPIKEQAALTGDLERIAALAMPHFDALARYRLR